MNALNAEDISKIIFLREDRLTKDTLGGKVSNLRKLWHESSVKPWGDRTGPMRWLESFVITRDNQVTLQEPHPKALIKALYELRAIGYSSAQVNAISTHVKDFMMATAHEYNAHIHYKEAQPKKFATSRNDNAFLGTASSDRDSIDFSAVFNNSAVLADQEAFYFEGLVASLNYKVSQQPDFLRLK
tara:strand:+ start:324271 stop:324828 length:558 start_codon:yes stop_codon:yes gene_type:complete